MQPRDAVMAKDYYEILGVSRASTQPEIQKAYRKLARENHPDLHPDDKSAKARFQEIQQAYDVLSDEAKRKKYDQFGPMFEQMGAGPAPGGAGGNWSGQVPPGYEGFDFSQMFGGGSGGAGYEGGGLDDLLRQFTGGAGPASRRRGSKRTTQRGSDLEHTIEIPFKLAISGGTTHIRIQRPKGPIETLELKVPAGIESGKVIRLRGQGEPGPGDGPPGDLLVRVNVQAHRSFKRTGNDLEVNVPITLTEAALGAKVDVPTPHGEVTLTIPPGTSSGKRIRIRGFGVKSKEGAGDLYAEMQIVLPEKIDDETAALLQQIAAKMPQNPREGLRW